MRLRKPQRQQQRGLGPQVKSAFLSSLIQHGLIGAKGASRRAQPMKRRAGTCTDSPHGETDDNRTRLCGLAFGTSGPSTMPYRLSWQSRFSAHHCGSMAFELQHNRTAITALISPSMGIRSLTAETVFYLVAALQSVERSVREGTRAEQVLHSPRRVILRRISRGLLRAKAVEGHRKANRCPTAGKRCQPLTRRSSISLATSSHISPNCRNSFLASEFSCFFASSKYLAACSRK